MKMPTAQSNDGFTHAADKAAISLSFFCGLHCLLLPVAVLLLPSAAVLGLDDEMFHRLMLIAVLPISGFALFSGQRRHGNIGVLTIGIAGLLTLIATTMIGHELLGETGERFATVIGSILVANSHLRNFRLCQIRAHKNGIDSKADSQEREGL